jgi:hypothetical protein
MHIRGNMKRVFIAEIEKLFAFDELFGCGDISD